MASASTSWATTPRPNLLAVRAALDALTLAEDGVDGSKIYLYGEGWNFGEVANDARFVQATQLNMDGTGIGTFNDRLRDAVRGGGPFDGDHRVNQGFASGLYTDPNGVSTMTPEEQRQKLLLLQDQIKVGLTGNLQDFEFVDRTGATVTGADVDYNGAPAGYTSDPQEAITYVEAHDNETLFDALAYKLPARHLAVRPAASADRRPEYRGARPGHPIHPRRQRAASLEVARPEQLRLGRLVQPRLLERDRQRLRFRAAAGGRQRNGVADHRSDPGQHRDRPDRGRHPLDGRPSTTRCGSGAPHRSSSSGQRRRSSSG